MSKRSSRGAFARLVGALRFTCLTCLAWFGATAHALVIFTNFQGGAMPGGSAFGTNQALAVQFTPAQNVYLTDVQMYVMSGGEGSVSALDVHLMTDAGDKPGAVIESLGKLPNQTSFTPRLEQILSKNNPLLTGNTRYWIAATLNPVSAVAGGWAGSGNPNVLTAFSNGSGLSGPWSTQMNGFQFIVSGSVSQPVCLLDVDANGKVDALTDGLMILRTMFGLTGAAVTANAVGANAARPTWNDIEPFIFLAKLDIDGNGKVDALTDGLLVLRGMFGLTGPAATANAIGANATRATWADVRGYFNASCGANFAP